MTALGRIKLHSIIMVLCEHQRYFCQSDRKFQQCTYLQKIEGRGTWFFSKKFLSPIRTKLLSVIV
jgi:hypothetical protein